MCPIYWLLYCYCTYVITGWPAKNKLKIPGLFKEISGYSRIYSYFLDNGPQKFE